MPRLYNKDVTNDDDPGTGFLQKPYQQGHEAQETTQ